MLAYRNPSNEDSDSIFNYTLKLDAYEIIKKLTHTRKILGWVRFKRKSGSILLDNPQQDV